jgi:hypothetical protein
MASHKRLLSADFLVKAGSERELENRLRQVQEFLKDLEQGEDVQPLQALASQLGAPQILQSSTKVRPPPSRPLAARQAPSRRRPRIQIRPLIRRECACSWPCAAPRSCASLLPRPPIQMHRSRFVPRRGGAATPRASGGARLFELQSIFALVASQLASLGDMGADDDEHFSLALYLLNLLAEIKCTILLVDYMEQSDEDADIFVAMAVNLLDSLR